MDIAQIRNFFGDVFKKPWYYISTILKWVLVSTLTGLVGGGVGTLFAKCIEFVTKTRIANDWLIYLMPVAGVAIVALVRLLKLPENYGTDQVFTAARQPEDVPIAITPAVFIGSVLTHLVGGSAGRESAALQIGGSIGSGIGKLLRLDEKNRHMMVLCGMSAAFSAIFGAPLTAAIFVLEVLSVGEMYYGGLVPCITSSLVASGIARLAGRNPMSFVIEGVPKLTVLSALQVAVMACICAMMSIIFCICMRQGRKYAQKFLKNSYLRIFAGSVVLIGLTLLSGTRDYNGDGMSVISAALGGNAVPYAFALKLLFTMITMSIGFKGGEIVPALFIGSTLGCALAPLVGLNPSFGAAIGLVCVFCGIVNCPMASMLLGVEMFGASGVLFFAIGCGISYTLSGYYGLYGSQKIVYSKLKTEYVNRYTH